MATFVSDLQLGAKLGNGHFGEVYKGHDPAHGEVAVKVLRRDAYHDDATWPMFKAGYLAEAQNLSKATHRNVVQVHHVVEAADGDSVMICMAFCAGGSLQQVFESGPMTLQRVRKVGTEVAWVLASFMREAWYIETSSQRTFFSTVVAMRKSVTLALSPTVSCSVMHHRQGTRTISLLKFGMVKEQALGQTCGRLE